MTPTQFDITHKHNTCHNFNIPGILIPSLMTAKTKVVIPSKSRMILVTVLMESTGKMARAKHNTVLSLSVSSGRGLLEFLPGNQKSSRSINDMSDNSRLSHDATLLFDDLTSCGVGIIMDRSSWVMLSLPKQFVIVSSTESARAKNSAVHGGLENIPWNM